MLYSQSLIKIISVDWKELTVSISFKMNENMITYTQQSWFFAETIQHHVIREQTEIYDIWLFAELISVDWSP